jgi:hypothetical protein
VLLLVLALRRGHPEDVWETFAGLKAEANSLSEMLEECDGLGRNTA